MKIKRKMYRRTSLFLALVIICCSLAPVTFASTVPDSDTIDVSSLSPSILSMLDDLDVVINEDSSIRLTPLSENPLNRTADGKTLSITNVDGNRVTTDTILVFGDDGAVPIQENNGLSRADLLLEFNAGGKIAIKATAAYNQYIVGNFGADYFAQPIGLSFLYTKLTSSAQVQNIAARYFCSGQVYSIPDFVNQDYSDGYTITVIQSYPAVSTHYGKTQPYSSSRVMWLNGLGAVQPGHYILCTAKINGTEYTESTDIYWY